MVIGFPHNIIVNRSSFFSECLLLAIQLITKDSINQAVYSDYELTKDLINWNFG